LGAVKKLADAAAENRAALVKIEADVVALEAMVAKGLAKLDAAGLRATIAPEINKIRSEDTKREASKANVLAWIKAQPDPPQYKVLARNNGISEVELLR
jgi:hypothetical protein